MIYSNVCWYRAVHGFTRDWNPEKEAGWGWGGKYGPTGKVGVAKGKGNSKTN